jgi:hypothetical protein
MNAYPYIAAIAVVLTTASGADGQVKAAAQGGGGGGRGVVIALPGGGLKVTESAPLEVTPVKNAAFLAEAVTEFTQILGDGNRIEHRYVSSIARDSRGRTRREEQIALLGPLASAGTAPRLVTILDPDSGVTYTLDEDQQIAFRNRAAAGAVTAKLVELDKYLQARVATKGVSVRQAPEAVDPAASKAVTESLGTKPMEGGVSAQGTRTTTTIPAGAIGNVLPIDIVSERWFSPELQMPVLIRRSDPRSGETIYRLTNIIRAEPPDALFTVPAGYEIRDGKLAFRILETRKIIDASQKKKLVPSGGQLQQ